MQCDNLVTDQEPESFIMGKGYYGLYQFKKALECFNEALDECLIKLNLQEINQENYHNIISHIYYYLGKTYLHLGDVIPAINYLKKHLEYNKSYIEHSKDCYGDCLDSIGLAFQYQGDTEQLAAEKKNFAVGITKKARNFYKEAENHYIEALTNKPNSCSALYNLGSLQKYLGKSKKAYHTLKKALKYCPQDLPSLQHRITEDYIAVMLELAEHEHPKLGSKICGLYYAEILNLLNSNYFLYKNSEVIVQIEHNLSVYN